MDCEQAGTWEFNALGQGINPGAGCDYQDEGNLVWTESDFVNISSSRWSYRDYHLSENSKLVGAVPGGEGEIPADMGPFGGPHAGYGLGPSTHTCLEQNSYLAGTWLCDGVEYGGQLNPRDSLGADTGKVADLHLLWLEGGERVEVLVSSPHFGPLVEVFHPGALRPNYPFNAPALSCAQARVTSAEGSNDVSLRLEGGVAGWYGIRISSPEDKMGNYLLKVWG